MKNAKTSLSTASGSKFGGKSLLLFSLLFVAGMLLSNEASCQQKPAASLSQSGVLQIPTNVPVAPAYVISLSSFGFANENEAIQYFSSKSYDSFFIRPNVSQNTAVIMLDVKGHAGWTVANWNNLLNAQTTTTPLLN